jgi:CubicO group peptidase (beta-lactamase class C family)
MPSGPRTEPTAGEATDAIAWRERLVELMAAHRVPGATLGILDDGKVTVAGAGVLSKATGVEVTP